jgi:multiple sugar transport system permease protein
MDHESTLERWLRGAALTVVVLFFMFPIFWIALMSFQTNETILRSPPSMVFQPTLSNYQALITGQLDSQAGTLQIEFMSNLANSAILSVGSVVVALLLGVPAAYAFARYKFRGSEDIAFTLLSFRFAPPLARAAAADALFPGSRAGRHLCRADLGVSADLPAADPVDRARLFRGHLAGRRIRLPHRRPWLVRRLPQDRAAAGGAGDRGGGAAGVHLRLEQLHLRAGAGLGRQAAGDGGRAGLRDREGIQYGQIAAAVVLSIAPTLALALYAQRYLVEGLSLGAVKG